MSPKTKAILKTTGVVFAGAATFAYLPLVSFAVAPQATAWLHVGLAAIHPLLGEALLAGGCLAGMGMAIKKTWSRYFAEKKLEKKIEQIVAQKLMQRQQEPLAKQKGNEKTAQKHHKNGYVAINKNTKPSESLAPATTKKHIVHKANLKWAPSALKVWHARKHQKDAA